VSPERHRRPSNDIPARWPGEVGSGTDRRQQVLDEREVEHLLDRDMRDCLAPGDTFAVSPSSSHCLSEKAANRYWHMIPCSSSAASQSM
jgi:hypothetical protein